MMHCQSCESKVPGIHYANCSSVCYQCKRDGGLHIEGCPLVRVTAARAAADTAQAVINHPKHYTFGSIEVIDAIEDWKLGFHEANAVKYIARAKHKGTELTDLKKAQWYLNRAIDRLESKETKLYAVVEHTIKSCTNCGGVGRVSAIGLTGATEPCNACEGKGHVSK